MFTQSVSWEKTSNMQSQDELYSFLGDRVGGFRSSVVRRGSEGSGWAFFFFFFFFFTNDIFNTPGKRAIPFPFQNYKNKLLRKGCKNKAMIFNQYVM